MDMEKETKISTSHMPPASVFQYSSGNRWTPEAELPSPSLWNTPFHFVQPTSIIPIIIEASQRIFHASLLSYPTPWFFFTRGQFSMRPSTVFRISDHILAFIAGFQMPTTRDATKMMELLFDSWQSDALVSLSMAELRRVSYSAKKRTEASTRTLGPSARELCLLIPSPAMQKVNPSC